MIVKTLINKEGRYLKDYALEKVGDWFCGYTTLLMAAWLTDDPKEALHFYTSMEAIVAKSWVGNSFDYKNIELTWI